MGHISGAGRQCEPKQIAEGASCLEANADRESAQQLQPCHRLGGSQSMLRSIIQMYKAIKYALISLHLTFEGTLVASEQKPTGQLLICLLELSLPCE